MKAYVQIIVFAIFATTAVGQNLIVNPGAELDPTTNGWTQASGSWVRGNEVTAQDGSYHFFAGAVAGTVELYQDVDVSSFSSTIDAGTQDFHFSGYIRDFNGNDEGQIIVEYRNASATVLSTYNTGLQSPTTWTLFCDTRTAPVNTRTIRIRLLSKRNAGSDNDGYMDNLILMTSTASGTGNNFIVNNSGECPPTTNGWTQASGSWVRGNEVTAQDGSYHFFAGAVAGTVELYQDVDVSSFATTIDAGTQVFHFSGYIRDFNGNDEGQIIVEYRNASATVLSTYNTGLQSPTTWTQFKDTTTAPANTRTIRIRLLSKRNAGSDNDGYIDNLILNEGAFPLPIELILFDAILVNHKGKETVDLFWKTATEVNNDHFTIERSSDATNWEIVGQVNGAGNSSATLSYDLTDTDPLTGLSYYRLKQTDFDGRQSYSSVRVVNNNSPGSAPFITYPNPTKNQITIVGVGVTTGDIKIYNLNGENVMIQTKVIESSNTEITIDMSELPYGQYLIKTNTTTNKVLKH